MADDVNATENAVAKAEELGVDLSDVEGSGTDGRITVGDVEGAAAPTPGEAAADAVADAGEQVDDEDPTFDHKRAVEDGPALAGVASYVVAGALENVSKKNLTVGEIKAAVSKFQRAEVR